MAIRVSSISLFALLASFFVATANAYNATCGELVVKVVANSGYTTNHKNCSITDWMLVRDAIYAVNGPQTTGTRRKLQSCPSLCEGILRTTCWNNYPQCRNSYIPGNCGPTWCRRDLEDLEENNDKDESKYIVLDDEFFSNPAGRDTGANAGDRRLEDPNPCGITEELCIQEKAKVYSAVIAAYSDLDTECANLILAPADTKCILVLPPGP